MITLYHASHSCSLAVKAALAATGIDFKTKIVSFNDGDHLKPDFLKINPLGKVPAIDIDGQVLTEGAAINLYLADSYPHAQLMPEEGSFEKADALKWLQFMYATLHPPFARVFAPERYGSEQDSIKQLAEKEIHKLLNIVDQQLSNHTFLIGEQMTLADLYLMTVIHWEGVLTKPIIASYKNIARFEQTMYLQDSVGEIFTQEYAA